MAYRLGWVLYWACLGLAIVLVAVWVLRFFHGSRAVAIVDPGFVFLASGAPTLRTRSSLPVRAGR